MTPCGGRPGGRIPSTLVVVVVVGVALFVGGGAAARPATASPDVLGAEIALPPVTVPSATVTDPPGRVGRDGVGVGAADDAAAGRPLGTVEGTVPSVDSVDHAVREDARRFGWPLVLGGLIIGFLTFQHRADRHERKLADAPLDQGERLRFR